MEDDAEIIKRFETLKHPRCMGDPDQESEDYKAAIRRTAHIKDGKTSSAVYKLMKLKNINWRYEDGAKFVYFN